MDLLKISTTTTSSKSSFSIDSLLDRGQKEAADAEDVPNEDEDEVDISITEDLQRPPPILIKPTPRLPFEESEELNCTEVNMIYSNKEIVIFYTEILTGKVVLWCFFTSETSEKIHNSTFLVKISV